MGGSRILPAGIERRTTGKMVGLRLPGGLTAGSHRKARTLRLSMAQPETGKGPEECHLQSR